MELDFRGYYNQPAFNVESPQERQAKQIQLQNAQMQQSEYERKMRQSQQDDDDKLAMQDIYRGATEIGQDGQQRFNPQKALDGIRQRFPDKAPAFEQQMNESAQAAAKQKQDAQNAKIEGLTKNKEVMQKVFVGSTPQDYKQRKQMLIDNGVLEANDLPDEFDPNAINSLMTTVESYRKGLEPKEYNGSVNYDEKGRAFVTDKFGAIKYLGTSKMPDSPKAPTLPSGYEANPAGGLMPIKGGPADPSTKTVQDAKLTETMRNAGMYAARMTAAEELIGGIGIDSQKQGLGEKIASFGGETAANLTRSDSRQQALQAQRDWVRAKLRKESGAAIGVDEMKNEIATYFPQLGDSEAVIEQKKQARMLATDELTKSAGGAYTYEAPNKADGNILAKDAKMPDNVYKGKAPPAKYPKARLAPNGNWYIKDAKGENYLVTK